MMSGITTAVSIVAGNTAAAFLVVYGALCGCPWGMNLCWIVACGFLYAPAVLAMRAERRPS